MDNEAIESRRAMVALPWADRHVLSVRRCWVADAAVAAVEKVLYETQLECAVITSLVAFGSGNKDLRERARLAIWRRNAAWEVRREAWVAAGKLEPECFRDG